MDIFIQVSQFILSLSLLIILHELGHFIPAKLFKTKVEKFYLFFDPYFSLFKKKVGETEYGIGWLPLGGYVKIAGMIDESMDKEQMAKPPKPWEFRSKPAWQRLIIMIGGVTVNVILAIFIYAGMMMYYGEEYLPNENALYGIMVDSTGEAVGLKNGDKIISVGDNKIERFSETSKEILLTSSGNIKVERDGKEFEIALDEKQKTAIIQAKSAFIFTRIPFVVGGFSDSSSAQMAGLEKGDSLVGLNHKPMQFFDEFTDQISQNAGNILLVHLVRDGKRMNIDVPVSEEGYIGVKPYGGDRFFQVNFKKYGFFEAFPKGLVVAKEKLVDYVRQFKLIANPETGAYKEVGGFIAIASQFDTVWNWQGFWAFTAFLSIMLAFLNILPIPALDGGHVVFVLWEMISGRKPPQKVLEYAQVVGFIILLTLLVLVNGNDIIKNFFGG